MSVIHRSTNWSIQANNATINRKMSLQQRLTWYESRLKASNDPEEQVFIRGLIKRLNSDLIEEESFDTKLVAALEDNTAIRHV